MFAKNTITTKNIKKKPTPLVTKTQPKVKKTKSNSKNVKSLKAQVKVITPAIKEQNQIKLIKKQPKIGKEVKQKTNIGNNKKLTIKQKEKPQKQVKKPADSLTKETHPFIINYYDATKEDLLSPNSEELRKLNYLISNKDVLPQNIIIKFIQACPVTVEQSNAIVLYLTRTLSFPIYYAELNSIFYTSIHNALRNLSYINENLINNISYENPESLKNIKDEYTLQMYLESETKKILKDLNI